MSRGVCWRLPPAESRRGGLYQPFQYASISAANIGRIEMANSEAKSTVEDKLRKQQLTKPMTETEMTAFCQAMLRNLELDTKGALSEIRGWAESWQATWFR
jgi:hypothetical protein